MWEPVGVQTIAPHQFGGALLTRQRASDGLQMVAFGLRVNGVQHRCEKRLISVYICFSRRALGHIVVSKAET